LLSLVPAYPAGGLAEVGPIEHLIEWTVPLQFAATSYPKSITSDDYQDIEKLLAGHPKLGSRACRRSLAFVRGTAERCCQRRSRTTQSKEVLESMTGYRVTLLQPVVVEE
jgi:hypothetical protein